MNTADLTSTVEHVQAGMAAADLTHRHAESDFMSGYLDELAGQAYGTRMKNPDRDVAYQAGAAWARQSRPGK